MIRTIYSTNGHMDCYPAKEPTQNPWNESGCSIAVGTGSDGRFQFAVMGPEGGAYALVDRDELLKIADAITRELHQ